jgi:hypothetical protein
MTLTFYRTLASLDENEKFLQLRRPAGVSGDDLRERTRRPS